MRDVATRRRGGCTTVVATVGRHAGSLVGGRLNQWVKIRYSESLRHAMQENKGTVNRAAGAIFLRRRRDFLGDLEVNHD